MDIASLRRELEEHLKLNPHHEAPEGFRDRFEHWAEAYEAETDEEAKTELEALLRRIPAEAEAAASCAMEDAPEAGAASDEGGATQRESPAPAAPDISEAADDPSAPRPEPPAPPSAAADETRADDGGAAPAADVPRREEPAPAPDAGSGAGTWLLLAAIVLALAAAAYFYLAR